jgi:hypothetical protein
MNHLTEDQLVLHYYREEDAPAAAETHLAECDACHANYEALCRTLNALREMPVPERGADYGAEVWQRVRPKIATGPRLVRRPVPHWVQWGAIAAMLAAAFFLGRVTQQPKETATAIPGQVKERILMVAVGDHLDRSQMVLAELVNTKPGESLDISGEQQRVEDLVSENRLYRQAAFKAGDTNVSNLLEELERVLLEVAHTPSQLNSAEFDDLRERIESQGILFKIRIVGSTVRERQKAPPGAAADKRL